MHRYLIEKLFPVLKVNSDQFHFKNEIIEYEKSMLEL